MDLRSIRGTTEEPVTHNPAAKKQAWFRKGDLSPFTRITRVVVPLGETHKLSNPSNNPIVYSLRAGFADQGTSIET